MGFALVSALAALATTGSNCAAAADWPARITAVYTVHVGGFNLGRFEYRSQIDNNTYKLHGYATLSWGFGLFKWRSTTTSSGSLDANGVLPAAYVFDYKSKKKTGSVKLKFDAAGVSSVSLVPPGGDDKDQVPLLDRHLKNVFDPMSALVALSRAGGTRPCERRISIFDGKQRFELVLGLRRQEQIREKRPSGQPTIAYVCSVRYIPVAGYKRNRETNAMAANKGIEAVLRPVPSANLMVPVRISIPSPVGAVLIKAKTIMISGPGNTQIALSQ